MVHVCHVFVCLLVLFYFQLPTFSMLWSCIFLAWNSRNHQWVPEFSFTVIVHWFSIYPGKFNSKDKLTVNWEVSNTFVHTVQQRWELTSGTWTWVTHTCSYRPIAETRALKTGLDLDSKSVNHEQSIFIIWGIENSLTQLLCTECVCVCMQQQLNVQCTYEGAGGPLAFC